MSADYTRRVTGRLLAWSDPRVQATCFEFLVAPRKDGLEVEGKTWNEGHKICIVAHYMSFLQTLKHKALWPLTFPGSSCSFDIATPVP